MQEEEKKETFEEPKVLNLEGEEITDDNLEEVSGGLTRVPGDCTSGTCTGGS